MIAKTIPRGIFVVLAVMVTMILTEAASVAEPFYDGKTIKLVVATKPGGGYDAYARLLVPRLKQYLPGSKAIVQNVPGAGHIIGANKIYTAKPDGLTFGTFNKGLITAQLMGMKGIRFDLAKMSWLGTPATEPRVLMISEKAPFKSLEDIKNSDKQCILSSAGIGSSAHTDALLIAKILNLKNIKVVAGFRGTEGEMAMMRGEVHGQVGATDSLLPMAENGEAHPILVIANERLKAFPDVPTLYDVAPADQKALVDLMVIQGLISRPYAGPPGIPEDRLKVLRDAFQKSWEDPGMVADAEKMGRPITFVNGEQVAEIVKSALNQPPEVLAFLKKISVAE